MLDKELRQVQFDMLMDNDLRREKLGEKILLIENVAIDGGAFNGESWEFIHFKDVDFYKGFTQATLKNVTFENCRFLDCTFAAIALEEVAFVKCKTKGQVFITAGKAKNLVFDGCDFTDNKETNQNNWGQSILRAVMCFIKTVKQNSSEYTVMKSLILSAALLRT